MFYGLKPEIDAFIHSFIHPFIHSMLYNVIVTYVDLTLKIHCMQLWVKYVWYQLTWRMP